MTSDSSELRRLAAIVVQAAMDFQLTPAQVFDFVEWTMAAYAVACAHDSNLLAQATVMLDQPPPPLRRMKLV